jgi:H+/Cl- antiporter ClcA
VLGVPAGSLAALGFVAVFCGAAKTPLACTVMGMELFGSRAAVPLALVCVLSFLASGRPGIYSTQRFADSSEL